MPKTKISEYSTTNTDNSDIESINIAEGCAPSGINNAIRELMVHLKEFQTGASGDPLTVAGAFVASAGVTANTLTLTGILTASGGTILSSTNTLSGSNIISGNINSSGTTNTFSGGNIFSGTNTISGSAIISGNINSSGTNTFSGSSVMSFSGGTSASPSIYFASDTNTGVFSPAADTIAAATGGTERLRIDSSGNVGIGTTTITERLRVKASNTTGSSVYSYINCTNESDSDLAILVSGAASTDKRAVIGTSTNTSLAFQTNGTERMRIDSSNNVLVGTTSGDITGTTTKISANGATGFAATNVNTGTGTYSVYRLGNANNTNRSGVVQFGSAWTTSGLYQQDGMYIYTAGNGGMTLTVESNQPMYFGTNNTERARITSGGKFCVGTTGFTSGAEGFIEIAGDVQNVRNLLATDNTAAGSTSFNFFAFKRNGTLTGSISNTNAATAFNTTSDYRLKENIAPMTGALATVAQLKPVTYTWKDGGESGQGFIAHELQEVCPDAVTGEKDAVDADGIPQYQGVDTSFLVATLTAAIQELKAITDAQATRIEALEAEVAAMKAGNGN